MKQIQDFPKYYITETGKVFKKNMTGVMKEVKPFLNHNNYLRVQIYKDGKPYKRFVHRLVIESYAGLEEGKQVNHKDGNKLNNNIENLEWVTPSENIQHAIKSGLMSFGYLEKKVVAVDMSTGEELRFKSLKEAERKTSVYASNIKKVINGERKHAGGFSWKYEMEDYSNGNN